MLVKGFADFDVAIRPIDSPASNAEGPIARTHPIKHVALFASTAKGGIPGLSAKLCDGYD